MNQGPHEVRLAKAKALVGKRIEIPVHYDMWMQGAHYGTVRSVGALGDYVKVKLDHPCAKRQLKVWAIDYDYVKVLEGGHRVLEALDEIEGLTQADMFRYFYAKADERAKEIAAMVQTNDELEVDGPMISESDDNGAWVNAWVWVDFSGTKLDKNEEDE